MVTTLEVTRIQTLTASQDLMVNTMQRQEVKPVFKHKIQKQNKKTPQDSFSHITSIYNVPNVKGHTLLAQKKNHKASPLPVSQKEEC